VLAAAAVLVALLLASAGSAAAQAQPGCTLTLYLNASASTVSLEGSAVVAPIQQPLVPTYPDALVGFEGALTLALPFGGPCPTSAEGIVQQLAGATLQTSSATGPLLLYPADSIEVRVPAAHVPAPVCQCNPAGSNNWCSEHGVLPVHTCGLCTLPLICHL
jgi:hypothetical protein